MLLWIKNTDGKEDAMLTMAFMALLVVLIKVSLSGVVVGAANFGIGPDASMVAALLTPTLSAYVARRYTDKKPATPEEPKEG